MDTAARTAGDVTFRIAAEADVDQLVGLVESAYRGEVSKGGWTTEADLLDGQRTDPESLTAVVRDRSGQVLIVERDGALVACCQLERRGEYAFFGMFAVRPDLQGAGLGNVIIMEAERIARVEWGAREMRMKVISVREELIAYYERRGYARAGMLPFPYGDERFGVPRRDDLRFVLLVKPLG